MPSRNMFRFAILCLLAGVTLATASMPAAAQAVEYYPNCTLPNCLNPRVISKTGVGTANATAELRVTTADATPWCAKNNPGYKYCVQDQVSGGGTRGASKYGTEVYRPTANCMAGTLTAMDKKQYKYIGTWPDGAGRGRSRFQPVAYATGARTWEENRAGLGASMTYLDVAAQDNSGESLAIQYESLCKGAPAPAGITTTAAPAPAAATAVAARVAAVPAPVAAPVPQAAAARPAAAPVAAAPAAQAGAAAAAAATAPICGGNANCTEVNTFGVVLTDLRPSQAPPSRLLTATLRFQNKTNRALVLAYVRESGMILDDQGNRYMANDATIRGLGLITGATFDAKFSLAAGEWADARIDFVWTPAGGSVIGTRYDPLEFTVREIDRVSATQNRLGREHALTIRNPGSAAGAPVTNAAPAGAPTTTAAVAQGAANNGPVMARAGGNAAAAGGAAPAAQGAAGTNNVATAAQGVAGGATVTGSVAGAAGANRTAAGANQAAGIASAFGGLFGGAGGSNAQPAGNAAAAQPVAAGVPGDPCGGNTRCYNAGTFTGTVTQLSVTQSATSRANRTVTFNVEFRNVSDQPIILAYKARTSAVVDNQGNRYGDSGATGIGVADGRSVNTQFQLGPGQARGAKFDMWRRNDGTVLGTSWTFDVTINEVQVLANGQQVTTIRENNIHFPDVPASTSPATTSTPSNAPPVDAIRSLGGLFGGGK